MKLRSCATLFLKVTEPGSPFERLLQRFFAGASDEGTLRRLPR